MTTETSKSTFHAQVEEILAKSYSRVVMRQPNGTWAAEIREIPSCYAGGATQIEAIENLEAHAREVVAHYLRKGQPIPPPLSTEFSGNFALRMPKGLHQRAAQMAVWEGTSLNQFINSAVAERVGYARQRAATSQQTFLLNASITYQSGPGTPSTTASPRPDIPGNIKFLRPGGV